MKLLRSKELGIALLLAVLCLVVGVMNHQFVSPTNIQNLARQTGMYGIFSIGMGFVIITSGIDLSVGSMFALLGVLLAILLNDKHWAPLPAVAVVIGAGMLLGWLHGLLITRVNLQPFIVTLCGLLIYRGLARLIANDETKGFSDAQGIDWLQNLASGSLFGIPTPFWLMLLTAAIAWVALHRSVYGRYLFALGRNEEAVRYSGIDTRRLTSSVYVLSGALAGITSVLLAFYTSSISPSSHGNSYELYAVAAAVLGGCSLRGGEGSIIGILIGTALIQVLRNMIILLGIPSALDLTVMGGVILLGVIADQVLTSRRRAVV